MSIQKSSNRIKWSVSNDSFTIPFKMFGMGQKVSSRLAYQILDPSLLTNKLWLVLIIMKQKKIQKNSKKFKWLTQKNWDFQNCQFSIFFFHGATSMPFPSINPTNPRTNQWNFHEKILRIGDFDKKQFFESAILNFIFKFYFILLYSHENKSKFIG